MKFPYLNKIPYIRVSSSSLDPEKQVRPWVAQSSPKPASYRTWLSVIWPLILHAFLAIGIVLFVTLYVDNTDFNLERRRPLVKLANGSMVPWVHYAPLQTDITTVLSIMIAVLRLVSACWLGPLCWRYAFILMEESGLRPTDLRTLVSYSVTATPPSGAPSTDKRVLKFVVWIALLVVLPVHLAAPVLTGSIAWVPSSPSPERLSNSTIFSYIAGDYDYWNLTLSLFPDDARSMIQFASYRPFMTWGQETSNGDLKRFIPSFSQLEVNSTVENVALPYFTIQAIKWFDNNNTLPGLNANETYCTRLTMGGLDCPSGPLAGYVALIPDTPWKSPRSEPPSMVTERQQLMIYADPDYLNNDRCRTPSCIFKTAWVTYSAGAAICNNCRVSSYATVQNDTQLDPQKANMTAETLLMMPYIMQQMLSNAGLRQTLPSWNSTDEYVIGMLTRSYASGWMVLNEQGMNRVYTNYSVSLPATRALVNFLRVYIWLGLQFLVTLSGILFLYIQAQSSSPLVTDTALAAFHLDSSALHDGTYNQFWGGAVRKVELHGDYLRVKAE